MYKFESDLWKKGYSYIVGVDEVGRGPLAGPVVAAAVVLDPNKPIIGLRDSKQLSSKQRQELLIEIEEKALDYAISFVSERIIESINIYQASKKAMLNAINSLSLKPDYILSDAMALPKSQIEYQAIIKGDTLSASIAAASIIAKEARDAYMIKQSIKFPGYDFEHNMGYPTKKHLAAIKRFGIIEIHRRTYKPIKDIIEKMVNEEDKMFKAVIFDLDGTLLDTISDISDSMNATLKKFNIKEYGIEDYKYLVGKGVDEFINKIVEINNLDFNMTDKLKNSYLEEYAKRKSIKTKPYPGIIKLLKRLNKNNVSLNILSNKPHYQVEEVVKKYLSDIEFDFVYGKKPKYPIKPNPTSIKEIIFKLNLDLKDILYVGDTNIDMKTAKNASLRSVGVLWGFRKEDELRESGASYIVRTTEELFKVIKGD